MRCLGAFSAAAAAAAVLTGLSGCANPPDDTADTRTTTATAPPPATLAPSARPTPTTPKPEPVELLCGTGPFGRSVTTTTAHADTGCATALAVLDAYAARSQDWGDGVVLTVAVGTRVWNCRQDEGPAGAYQICADKDDPAETIRLGG